MPVDFLDIDFNISDENYFLCVSNKNKETNPNVIDLSNPIVEWMDDFC